jgi:hypothetical protein
MEEYTTATGGGAIHLLEGLERSWNFSSEWRPREGLCLHRRARVVVTRPAYDRPLGGSRATE